MRNPCELEIDLFCLGLRVPEGLSLEGSRALVRTRAGLGSGLEVVLQTGLRRKPELWLNAPVAEPFALRSPYRLTGEPGAYTIVDDRSGAAYPVRLPPAPAWYERQTSRDIPMHRIGVMQGTYLGIYLNPVCAFWNYSPPLNCRFCTTGQNVGTQEAAVKTVSDVVETCWAAKEESGVTFVHLNGGFQGSRGFEFARPYVEAIKQEVGMLVGLQLAPERDFSRYDEVIEAGVDHLSFCLELLDPEWFGRICPGKARVHGQALFVDSIAYCADHMPKGAVSGEIIAGIEPIEKTLEAIDLIVDAGAFPTVCIFRPTVGSDMEDWPPPSYDDMRAVMAHLYAACRRRWLPIGAAPNIEVSLVVNPDDAAFLAPRTPGYLAYGAWRRAVRMLARPVFHRRMRAGMPSQIRARRLPSAEAGHP